MKPGHGEVLLAEGDVQVEEDERALIEEFRRQLDSRMWAAVPIAGAQLAANQQLFDIERGRAAPGTPSQ